MDQSTIELLFALLRSSICGKPLTKQEASLYRKELLPELYAISKKHDVAHLLATALEFNSLPTDEDPQIKKAVMMAVYRYTRLNYEYEALCQALEEAQIPFIPLKGSVLRQYYPEPWMRTSCDIDVLVHEEEVEQAADYLVKHCGYSRESMGSHDISLFTPVQNHIELHYDLVEDGLINQSAKVLRSVWDASATRASHTYWREMPDALFYFYHIAHMAKHFEEGGCGIRPFIDLWILDRLEDKDHNKRDVLLQQGDLLKFAEVVRQLSRVWFESAAHSAITKQTEQYILRGGVYGTNENRIAVQQQKKGGRLKYALSKIFLSYDVIKFHYPILQKHRWLTPIMEVRRWFKLLFCGHARRSVQELKQNSNISHAEAENIQAFLSNIGL